jgi:hypothetical protein
MGVLNQVGTLGLLKLRQISRVERAGVQRACLGSVRKIICAWSRQRMGIVRHGYSIQLNEVDGETASLQLICQQ